MFLHEDTSDYMKLTAWFLLQPLQDLFGIIGFRYDQHRSKIFFSSDMMLEKKLPKLTGGKRKMT